MAEQSKPTYTPNLAMVTRVRVLTLITLATLVSELTFRSYVQVGGV